MVLLKGLIDPDCCEQLRERANHVLTVPGHGKVISAKTLAFVKAVKVPVQIPLGRNTMSFNGDGKCTAGC